MMERVTVHVTFYAHMPDDASEGDERADAICDLIFEAVDDLPYVATGSVSVEGWDAPAE